MPNKILAQRVKEYRKQKGLSQDELAKRSGLSLRTIQRIEYGETKPTGETLKRISIAFSLSPEGLLNEITTEDDVKATIANKYEYLHILEDKLIFTQTGNLDDSVTDYKKSLNNLFKTLTVFVVSIPIFAVLAGAFYRSHPNLSLYAGASACFFMLMAIYTMLFTSGAPIIDRKEIKKVKFQNTIWDNNIVISYNDMGRIKRRGLLLTKDTINDVKNTLLKENLLTDSATITDKKNIGLKIYLIAIPVFIFLLTQLNIIKAEEITAFYGFVFLAFCGYILFLIIKGFIDSAIWRKNHQQAVNRP